MKYKTVILAVGWLILGCQAKHPDKKEPAPLPRTDSSAVKTPVFTLDMVVNQKDPACYMSLREGIGDTVHYHGKVYGFCSTACKKEFLTRPSYYVKD